MIKNVFLDLDDTILDFKKAEAIAIRKTFLEMGLNPTDEICERYSIINKVHWQRLERGEITRPEVQRLRFEALFSEYGIKRTGAEAHAVYAKYLSMGHYFIKGAQQMLEELCCDYDLYILSNGNLPIQRPRIESANIRRFFKGIFISEEMGYDKPRKEFFDECFKHVECPDRDATVMIGDSLTSDILGGKNAGIRTVHFDPTSSQTRVDIVPDFRVSSLGEIPPLLKKL